MTKLKAILFLLFITIGLQAQVIKNDNIFSEVFVINNDVAFIKEVDIVGKTDETSYLSIKEWANLYYAKDIFNSSFNFRDQERKGTIKSRVELLLPENSSGERDKIIMRYRLNISVKDHKCIMEFVDISFINPEKEKNNTLPQKIKAKDLITDEAIAINDSDQKTRNDIRKSVLYYLNELSLNIQTLVTK